jgi:hypothetical protein
MWTRPYGCFSRNGAGGDPREEDSSVCSLVRTRQLSRRVLAALRRAGELDPRTDLVRAVMIDTGLDPADRASFARVQWKVRDTLNRLNKGGLLASDSIGHGVLWRIADQAA